MLQCVFTLCIRNIYPNCCLALPSYIPPPPLFQMANLYHSLSSTVPGGRFEIRPVSSIANPYLTLAATLAAGLDGLARSLLPPPAGKRQEEVPGSLAEALSALQQDHVIKAALGEQFISWWSSAKSEYEIKTMGHHHVRDNITEELEIEKKYYFNI